MLWLIYESTGVMGVNGKVKRRAPRPSAGLQATEVRPGPILTHLAPRTTRGPPPHAGL